MEESLKDKANRLRASLKEIENDIRSMMDHSEYQNEQAYKNQHGEMKAQTMLAVRHMEDARMRLGKVIQYSGDGVSIYDKS